MGGCYRALRGRACRVSGRDVRDLRVLGIAKGLWGLGFRVGRICAIGSSALAGDPLAAGCARERVAAGMAHTLPASEDSWFVCPSEVAARQS